MSALGALRLGERMLLAGAAFSFSNERTRSAIGITILLAGIAALRAVARAPLLATIRRRFLAFAADVLLRRDAGASDVRPEGETEVILFDGLWAVEDLAAERVPGIVADAIAAAVIGGLLVWTLPPRMIGVGIVVLLVAARVAEGARRVSGAHAQKSWEAFLPVASSVEACIHGGAELVGNGRERDQRELVRARTERWVRASWRADWLSGLSGRLPILLGFIGVLVAVVWAQHERGATTEAAIAQALVVASFLPPFASLVTNLVEVTRATPKLAPLKELLGELRGEEPSTLSMAEVPRLPDTIAWNAIDYAYPASDAQSSPRVLEGCSGEWQPGRVLALAGPNGAGKSTLFRLLLGFDRPSRGTITVGETPLGVVDMDAWRRSVAYLAQRPFLPKAATVREAVRFLAREATDAEITSVLKRVGVWERLVRESKDAPLDVSVGALSAGERQRVVLARVLAQDAALVLLDEPDANLDRAGVALLGALLRELASDPVRPKMVAFIAHDEDLLRVADDVLRFAGRRGSASTRAAGNEDERWLSSGSRFM